MGFEYKIRFAVPPDFSLEPLAKRLPDAAIPSSSWRAYDYELVADGFTFLDTGRSTVASVAFRQLVDDTLEQRSRAWMRKTRGMVVATALLMARRYLVGTCALLVACGGPSGGGPDGGDGGGDATYRVEPSCVLAMEAAASPIVAAASGPCDFGFSLSVAAGANDVAYVGFTSNIGGFHPRLWSIDPKSTPTVEKDPSRRRCFT